MKYTRRSAGGTALRLRLRAAGATARSWRGELARGRWRWRRDWWIGGPGAAEREQAAGANQPVRPANRRSGRLPALAAQPAQHTAARRTGCAAAADSLVVPRPHSRPHAIASLSLSGMSRAYSIVF